MDLRAKRSAASSHVQSAPVVIQGRSPLEIRDGLLTHFDRTRTGTITAKDFKLPGPSSAIIMDAWGAPVLLKGPEQISRAAQVAAEKVRKGDPLVHATELNPPRTLALREEINDNWKRLVRSSRSIEDIVATLSAKSHVPVDGTFRAYVPSDDLAAIQEL